jgi:hypothetical protein
MSEELKLLLSALNSNALVSAETMRGPMGNGDLRARGVAYHVLQRVRGRIVPPLSTAEQRSFMLDYLFDCLLSHPESDDYLHSGFEAAWELAGWVKLLKNSGENYEIISKIVERLTDAYMGADDDTRNRIETGLVEHLMETPSLREYFASWKGDPTLGTAYELCLQWGKHHEET